MDLTLAYSIYIKRKPTIMTNTATLRPTAAQLQKNQARLDRKAAAAERRQNDYRQDAGFINIYAA